MRKQYIAMKRRASLAGYVKTTRKRIKSSSRLSLNILVVERQDLTDDQSSFEGFDSDDVNPDIDADNSRSSSISSLIPQFNEVSRSASNSENLQTFERSSSSQREGIDITVLKARERLQTSRKQMATRYNRRTKAQVFQPGQIVTVKIPKIDRSTATGSRRCYAEILRAKNNRYEMRTEYGVLDRWYAARDIYVVPEALARNKSIPASDKFVALRISCDGSSHNCLPSRNLQ